MRHLELHLRKDASRRDGDPSPTDLRQLVALEKDGQQYGEDLSGGGNLCADERVEGGDGVEDERLPDGRAPAPVISHNFVSIRKFYGIYMEEDTFEAKLPHKNGIVGSKVEILGSKGA